MTKLNIPVLLIVFNRSATTRQVFETIRQARPPKLYVAADGPRKSRPGEADRVAEVCSIATQVDWPCEVRTLFQEENLGAKIAVSTAINWFFENEEMGIILEHDCLPHPDFFTFCEILLQRFYSDNRVFMITGNNFQNGQQRGEASYYFSKYNHIWGWASWRRAWNYYQVGLSFWPEWSVSSHWKSIMPDKIEARYWSKNFDSVYRGNINTWDYQWTACVWKNGGLTATPNVNLVSNIGFGEDALHTTDINSPLANMPLEPLEKITHPSNIIQDLSADKYTFDHVFGGRYLRFPQNIIRLPRRIAGALYRRIKRIVL